MDYWLLVEKFLVLYAGLYSFTSCLTLLCSALLFRSLAKTWKAGLYSVSVTEGWKGSASLEDRKMADKYFTNSKYG